MSLFYIYFLKTPFHEIEKSKLISIIPEFIKLCEAIRAIFFISNSIRKENKFYIINWDKNSIIEFDGSTLKHLRPDLGNIFKFLVKASKTLQKRAQKRANNGITNLLAGVNYHIKDFAEFIKQFDNQIKYALFIKNDIEKLKSQNFQNSVIFLNSDYIIEKLKIQLIPADIDPFDSNIINKILLFHYELIDL